MPNLVALAAHTRRFYEWELAGRGWQAYPHLVPLEPIFRPFPGHLPAVGAVVDDGRRETPLARLFRRRPVALASLVSAGAAHENPSPTRVLPDEMAEMDILIPPETKIDAQLTSSLLLAISSAQDPLAFELMGVDGRVSVRLVASEDDFNLVRNQVQAFLPGALIRSPTTVLTEVWQDGGIRESACMEFGLGREFMLSLREPSKTPDPATAFIGALALTRSGEGALFQVLFTEARAPWGAHAACACTAPDGESFFLDFPQLPKFADEKFSHPLYAVAVRILAGAETFERAATLAIGVAGALTQFGSPDRNDLVPLSTEDPTLVAENILIRGTNRSGMLLSLPELAALVRLPGADVRTGALVREPEILPHLPEEVRLDTGTVLGTARHEKDDVPVRLSDEARMQHTYLVGASGTGKSTLLENMILQDIRAGHGVGVLDPHGDLVDAVLARIPEERIADIILFDPAEANRVVGWNILGAHSEIEKDLLSSDLVAVFRRLSTSWGDQMSVVLANAVVAFLESRQGGTIVELRKFLLDESFRENFLTTVSDDHVLSFWREEFALLVGKKPQAPILTRLDTFLRSRLIREAVCEREKPLNFREIIDSGKIFLGKLSQGAIGEENAALLGSLLVSKFHQVSLSRQDTALAERRPFFLFLDEFHHFATPSMAGLFSGVRKYRLGLTVAHQELYQLRQNAPEVERSVQTNAYARIVFRVSDEDAKRLASGMGTFAPEDLANLGRGQAICRAGKREDAFRLKTEKLEDIPLADAEEKRERVRRESLARYGRARGTQKTAEVPGVRTPTPPPLPKAADAPVPAPPPNAQGVPALSVPGRGGPGHKYLQCLVREWGQARGFKAEIERELPDGKRVDILLSRGTETVACEIGAESTIEQETANISKCLSAGFTHVCSVSMDAAFLRKLSAFFGSSFPTADRVRFFAPEELLTFLSGLAAPAEKRVAGYRVSVHEAEATPQDAERKRLIADVLLKSVRRMKEKR